MNLFAGLFGVNYLAVLVAVIVANVLGMRWYSPKLFGKQWMSELGLTMETMNSNASSRMLAGIGLVAISAILMSLLFGGAGVKTGIIMGLLLSLGFIVTNRAMHYTYAQGSQKLFWINSGFDVLTFVIMGAIIGAW